LDCEKEPGSMLWIFVMTGNIIRGMGETPIMPLGISYLEDFAKAENSPFYLGTSRNAPPCCPSALSSLCPPQREVLPKVSDRVPVTGSASCPVCVSFTFVIPLPPTCQKWALTDALQGWDERKRIGNSGAVAAAANLHHTEQCMTHFIKHITNLLHSFIPDFIPYLKALFRNPVYMLFVCITVLQFSAFNGMVSFMPKYLEQQFGKSASDAIFLIGVYNLPVICIGYFLGGLFMKKFKTNTSQAATIAFWISLLEYLLYFSIYWTICDASPVAGLTVSYE
ncbi:SO1A2 protein, partial [Crypturellus soui]|nr:SO1A2 protein [Crypturellus soui]